MHLQVATPVSFTRPVCVCVNYCNFVMSKYEYFHDFLKYTNFSRRLHNQLGLVRYLIDL